MQIGLLYPYDKNKAKKENCALGIELQSMLDELNVLEIKHNYDFSKICTDIKSQLMVALGKVRIAKEENDVKEHRDA